MRHSIERMLSKPNDYKRCRHCGCWNWYENDECINCGHTKFRKVNTKDIEGLRQAFEGYDGIELEV